MSNKPRKCLACGRGFRNKQAARAHLRFCAAYLRWKAGRAELAGLDTGAAVAAGPVPREELPPEIQAILPAPRRW